MKPGFFFDRHSKYVLISNFMKIHPDGVELFHADGQTGMTRLIVALGNFANAPKYGTQILWQLVYTFPTTNNRYKIQSCYYMHKFSSIL